MIRYGASGKGRGKLGSSVFSINHGVQIEREYNGSVSNPNTPAQVSQRARFKLASQISAAFEDVIAIPRLGIQSPRNRFTKRNFQYIYGDSAGAQVSYENLQLTIGSRGLPGIYIERFTDELSVKKMTIRLADSVYGTADTIVYNVFKKTSEEYLQLVGSKVVRPDENNQVAQIVFNDIDGDLVAYAYGLKAKTDKARAKYSQYEVANGLDVARLFVNRVLETKDYAFTQTRGQSIFDGDNQSTSAGPNQSILYVTISGYGSVNATGTTLRNGRAVINNGSSVQLEAVDGTYLEDGVEVPFLFRGWKNNGSQNFFSTSRNLSLTIYELTDIVAVFTAATNEDAINGLE